LKLFPFQEEGVSFLLDRKRAYLCDEMGLGKTPQAIVAARDLGIKRTMVVCPASVVENWKQEWETWKGPGKLAVISYAKLVRQNIVGDPGGGYTIILDEAHYCKTISAQRTKAALSIARTADRAWLLSGTPMPNDPRELWSVVKILWPEVAHHFGITNQFQWMDRWCIWSEGEYGYRVWGLKPDAKTLLIPQIRKLMLRRKIADVAIELPPLRTTVEWLPRDDSFGKELERLGMTGDAAHISTLRRVLGSHKAPLIAKQLVAELKEGNHQTVVMYHHRDTGSLLHETFDRAKLSVVGFDGAASSAQRQHAIDAFQDGKARIFLAQQTAAGIGITLTAASDIVLVEPSWSPEDNRQAIKRIHRIGQSAPCRARLFAVPDTIDAAIMKSTARKMDMIEEVIG